MATPNGLNPTFEGRARAKGFEALHGKGVCVTSVSATGTAAVNFFGTTNGFNGTITGVIVTTLGTTGQTMTLTNANGTAAITTASSIGGVVGSDLAGSALTTAITASGTLTISSSSSSDSSIVTITYKVSES